MSTTRLPPARITGPYGSLLKLGIRKMLGRVPESAEVMWNNPRVFKDTMRFGRITEKWSRIDPTLATLGTMAAAAEIGCGACLDFGYFMAHRKGLDEAKVRDVPRWRESDLFTPLERRVMAYAEAMCQTPITVTDEMSADLLAALGPAALLELTSKIGFMNLSARSNLALGIHSPEFATSCGLPPLSVRSAATRP